MPAPASPPERAALAPARLAHPHVALGPERIALTRAEAETLLDRGIVHHPDPHAAPDLLRAHDPDELRVELHLIRTAPPAVPAPFETEYRLAHHRGGRTLYLDGDGNLTHDPHQALTFTPEGRAAYEADHTLPRHPGATWEEVPVPGLAHTTDQPAITHSGFLIPSP